MWVNMNGSVTFDAPIEATSGRSLGSTGQRIIAPFFADVRASDIAAGQISYGQITYGDEDAFCVVWDGVGSNESDLTGLTNLFQLVLVDRDSSGFDVIFNYERVATDVGSSAVPGSVARAGFFDGEILVEPVASGLAGAVVDNGPAPLSQRARAIDVPTPIGSFVPTLGRFEYKIRDGAALLNFTEEKTNYSAPSGSTVWLDHVRTETAVVVSGPNTGARPTCYDPSADGLTTTRCFQQYRGDGGIGTDIACSSGATITATTSGIRRSAGASSLSNGWTVSRTPHSETRLVR